MINIGYIEYIILRNIESYLKNLFMEYSLILVLLLYIFIEKSCLKTSVPS